MADLLKSLLDLHFDRQNNRNLRQIHQPKGGLPVDFIEDKRTVNQKKSVSSVYSSFAMMAKGLPAVVLGRHKYVFT